MKSGIDTQAIYDATKINIYTQSYLMRLKALNDFVRARVAEKYIIIKARLLPKDEYGEVVLDRNFTGEIPPFLRVKQNIGG